MAGPFGFSIADLARAISLSKEIYTACFTESQGANVKYRQFLNNIEALGNSLERLQEVVRNSESQYPRRDWHTDTQRRGAAENVWSQLTGDFYQTLQECDSLLRRHSHLRNGRTNVPSNLRWWLSVEGTVNNLNARLEFHVKRVEFYTRPSEFESIVRNGGQLQELRRQVAKLERMMSIHDVGLSQTLCAIVLSNELKAKFEVEFNANRPLWFVSESKWPLIEGFKALAFYFAQSTVRFNSTTNLSKPDVPQFLNLAKSIWILEQINRSDHFMATIPESFWAGRMREVEDGIRGQLHRFEAGELVKPPEQCLLELPDILYSIDNGSETNPDPLDAGKAGPLDEKILEIELLSDSSNRKSALLVFRENEADFRLVASTKQADPLMAQYDLAVEVNMERHRLIPVYSNPAQGSSPGHNLLILNERGRKPKEYAFYNSENVKKFQRALTGYRVHHDMPVARWCINGSGKPGNSGKGLLQLWQFKPLPPISEANSSSLSNASSSVGSAASPVSSFSSPRAPPANHTELTGSEGGSIDFVGWQGFPNTPITETPRISRSFSQASSLAAQSNNGSYELRRHSTAVSSTTLKSQSSIMSPVRGGGTEFLKPELPVLILFTNCNNRYTFLHLTLDASIHVQPKSCGCRNPKLRCNRVILESQKKSFAIRMLSADEEGGDGLESWDLSVFRFPRSKKLEKTTINEKVETLELRFTDEDEKDEFLKELLLLENVRTANQNDYTRGLRGKTERTSS